MNEDKKIKVYKFCSGYNKVIATIPARSLERAKEIFKETNIDKKYLFIEVAK